MLHVIYKLFKTRSIFVLIIFSCTLSSFGQENQDVEKQKAQIEEEINRITQSTNWQDPGESDKANKRLIELANQLSNLSMNQVVGTLKNTDVDNSFKLGDRIIDDFKEDNPEQIISGTDSSVTVLCLTKLNLEAFEMLDRLYDFPNLSIAYINGYQLDNMPEIYDVIEKLSATNLKELYIVGFSNSLTQMPDNIDKLSNLNVLGLYGNSLAEIPGSIFSLTGLTELYLDANPIVSLPVNQENVKTLKILGLKKTNVSQTEINRLKNLFPQCDIQN